VVRLEITIHYDLGEVDLCLRALFLTCRYKNNLAGIDWKTPGHGQDPNANFLAKNCSVAQATARDWCRPSPEERGYL
jgi:hypothetical protein